MVSMGALPGNGMRLLPVPNLSEEFKSTYLRAPGELDDNIADSCVSAKTLFVADIFIQKYFRSSEKRNLEN